MGWGEAHLPTWESVAKKLMDEVERYLERPTTGNQERLTRTLEECLAYSKENNGH